MTAPFIGSYQENVAAVAAASDLNSIVQIAQRAATVTGVTYTPPVTLTGAATETRSVFLVNKGPTGALTVIVASLAFLVGVNATVNQQRLITLSLTPANLNIAAGDILLWQSIHTGSTGLADPGGRVSIATSAIYA